MSDLNNYYLSAQQRRLVTLESAAHKPVTQMLMQIPHPCDPSLFREIVSALVRKHEILRTVYVKEPGIITPLQSVRDFDPAGISIDMVQGNRELAEARMNASRAKVGRDIPFDVVVVEDETKTFLIFTLCGYAADTASLAILCEEITTAIAGNLPQADIEDITYPEFSQWQEEVQEQGTPEQMMFWQQYPVSQHQYFHFRQPGTPGSSATGTATEVLSPLLAAAISNMYPANREAVFITAWLTVLAKQQQVRTVTSGYKPYERGFTEFDHLVGLVTKTLPLTISFDDMATIGKNITLVAQAVKNVADNQYSYVYKDTSPVLGAVCSYLRTSAAMESIYLDDHQGDISLLVIDTGDAFTLQWQYNAAVYEASAVMLINKQLQAVLTAAVQPVQVSWKTIPMILPEEQAVMISAGTGISRLPATVNIPDALKAIAATQGDKIAVTCNDTELSYSALEQASDKLAQVLVAHYGILPGDRVGVLMERSEILIVVFLAIIKSGAVYVPADPQDASERIGYIITDSCSKLLVTDDTTAPVNITIPVVAVANLLDEEATGTLLPVAKGTDAAYMIYTSGTSGRLKGVPVKHSSLLNYVGWIQHTFDINADDSAALLSSHAFDLGYTSLWGMLLSGGVLHIVPEYLLRVPAVMVRYLESRKVTCLKTTPSFFNLLLKEAAEELRSMSLRILLLGGEKFRAADVAAVWEMHPQTRIINHYGPTETTIGIMAHEMIPARLNDYRERCIIGQPADNHTVLVLNEQLEICPPGIPGEICIAGAGLSDGYFQQEEFTATRFVQHVPTGLRLYKTGDAGCRNFRGELEFIGRLDKQVKINGYRVELSEIEAAVKTLPGIDDALIVAIVKEDSQLLACYYVAVSAPDITRMRELLSAKVPSYMIPVVFKKINAVPLTINGKINYQALPEITMSGEGEDPTGPRNEAESMLLAIWKDVLGKEQIGIYDNFFQLGGDSIKAIQISSRLHTQGYHIHVREIFSHPDVSSQATVIRLSATATRNTAFEGNFPLTPVYRYFFENIRTAPHHYNQAMLLEVGNTNVAALTKAFDLIFAQHDILRLTFKSHETGMQAIIQPPGFTAAIGSSMYTDDAAITQLSATLQQEMNLREGPLVKLHFFEATAGNLLLIILHHTVTDVVSWNILLDDLNTLLEQQQHNEALSLWQGNTSYAHWASWLEKYAADERLLSQLPYWQQIPQHTALPAENPSGSNRICDVKHVSFSLSAEDTHQLINKNRADNHGGMLSSLLAALGMAWLPVMHTGEVLLMLESHGREELDADLLLNRTMGWFTALYPFLLQYKGQSPEQYEKMVALDLQAIPEKGSGYGVLRYMNNEGTASLQHAPAVRFNYLGNSSHHSESRLVKRKEHPSLGLTEDQDEQRPFMIDIIAGISAGVFYLHLSYSSSQFSTGKMSSLLAAYRDSLLLLINSTLFADTVSDNHPVPFDELSQLDFTNFFE